MKEFSLEVTKYCPADGRFYTFKKSNQNCPFVHRETISVADDVAEVLGFLKDEKGEVFFWFQIFGETDFRRMKLGDVKANVKFLM